MLRIEKEIALTQPREELAMEWRKVELPPHRLLLIPHLCYKKHSEEGGRAQDGEARLNMQDSSATREHFRTHRIRAAIRPSVRRQGLGEKQMPRRGKAPNLLRPGDTHPKFMKTPSSSYHDSWLVIIIGVFPGASAEPRIRGI